MSIDMEQFYQTFFDESAEHLDAMESLLLSLDVEAPDIDELNAIFRAAHSIKGGSGTFGFTDMTEVTHVLENLLDRLRKSEMKPSVEMIDAFLETVDVLKHQLQSHINGARANSEPSEAICKKLHALAEQQPALPTDNEVAVEATPPGPTSTYEIEFRPSKKFLKTPASQENLIADLERLGELEILELTATKGRKKNNSKSIWRFRLMTAETEQSLREIFEFIADPEDIRIVPIAAVTVAEDDLGFGFFDLAFIEEDSASDAVSNAIEDEGFGFFVDLPPPAASENQPPAAPTPVQTAKSTPVSGGESSIRVSIERVDQLINLVGELVITQAMLAQTGSAVDPVLHERLHTGLSQLERNTRDLQEAVMSIRMMPISFVFSRFPRVVRDLAAKLNKQVELVTIGEMTELDKGLIEKIADPLTHLVRNSLDHGIELPDTRTSAGKPAKGTITLSASHQGGNIEIQVADDGAGLNREKILSKAQERGLTIHDHMSDTDVWMLIFEPGFSTAEVVTDVSGRGVGMDVVKRNITGMGGSVSIQSEAGQGSTITIRLPLTLAILDGMTVALGDNIYVIPLNTIVETLQPQPEDIKTVTGEGRMVHVRGEYLPIIALHHIFHMPTAITDPCQGVLVLIEADGHKAALFVDSLVGQQQVVIKSLETNFRRIVGISGATIMGDGTVALILDIPTLIKLGQ